MVRKQSENSLDFVTDGRKAWSAVTNTIVTEGGFARMAIMNRADAFAADSIIAAGGRIAAI
jgi:hypothetical protein